MVNPIICAACKVPMEPGILSRYEYLEGVPLHHVPCYLCPKCNKTFFTYEQAKDMQTRTREIHEHSFGFERKVLTSGSSLVVGIPNELAEHLKLKKGQKVRILPVADDGFLVRKSA